MKTGIKVGDIMTRDYISVSPETSLQECAKKMIKKKVGSLVVEKQGRIVGLITERDIIYALTKKPRELGNVKAGNLARKKVITIKPSADLYEALQKMRKTKYRWLPVVVKKNVVGFLTLKDILHIEPDLFESIQEMMQIREESEKMKRLREARKGKRWIKEGICEECGQFGLLYDVNGVLLCENCADRL